ncbi:MAG TPA: ABC transporter permease [Terriglobales bacterium]|nr:ABC transporter permease [Terriglobales bacterium]
MKYLGRRVIRAVLLLFGISVLCFLFTEMAPGSFFDEMRLNPQISPETISSMRSRYGLDQPLVVRYGRWVRSALQADFGYSIAYNTPVAPLLWTRAKNTLLLNTVAMLLTWTISVPLGVWVATRRRNAWDRAIDGMNSILISIPEIVIAVALLAIAVRWRVLPVGGMTSVDHEVLSRWGRGREIATHMLMPTIMLVLVECSVIVRHVRASVIDVLGTPFVQAARGLGIGNMRLLYRHVLPVAANPIISLLGLSLAGLMSGSLLIEVICGWPGLGPLILDATLSRDLYLVIGGIMLSTLFMLGGNLIADAMLLACDPRIRTGSTHES